jgi:Flp pilus assembly pilin Flp
MVGTQQQSKSRWDDRGAGLVEYALLLALIAFVCIGALQFFGITNGGSINNSANSVVTAGN